MGPSKDVKETEFNRTVIFNENRLWKTPKYVSYGPFLEFKNVYKDV